MKTIATLFLQPAVWLAGCERSSLTIRPDVASEDPVGAWALERLELADGRIVFVPDPLRDTRP